MFPTKKKYRYMKKIVFIDGENLTKRRREIFWIDEIRAAGFEVEFWDVSKMIVDQDICDQLDENYLRKFSNIKDFEEAIQKQDISNTIFVIEIWYKWITRKMLYIIKKNKCFTLKIQIYSKIYHKQKRVPKMHFSLNLLKYLSKKLVDELSYVCFKIYQKVKGIDRHFDYHITADSRSRKANAFINHPDWQSAKDLELQPRSSDIPQKPYVVFVDQFYPLHPDFKRNYIGQLGDAETYYSELNDFFAKIERDLGYEVVIAAHPKATYDDKTFNSRKIIKYKTSELVKYSEGVLMQTSLSISFVMIFDKPVMYITTREQMKSDKLLIMEMMYTDYFKLPLYITNDIDEVTPSMMQRVEPSRRDEYIYTILTHEGIEDRANSDIVIENLKKLS